MAASSRSPRAPDKAIEWGVDETRVLPFSAKASAGGIRYGRRSVFPPRSALGWDVFEELLEGAAPRWTGISA